MRACVPHQSKTTLHYVRCMNRHTVAHAWSREQGWIAARTAQWAFYWAVKKQEATVFQKKHIFEIYLK